MVQQYVAYKKKAKAVQSKAKSYLGKIWDKGKDTLGKIGSAAASTVKKHAKVLADQGMKFLSDHQDELIGVADAYINHQADKYAGKASATMDKYAAKGKKKGSGTYGIQRTSGRMSDYMSQNQNQVGTLLSRYRSGKRPSSQKPAWLKRQEAMGLK